MGHSNVRLKVRRRKVAHLAAYSRQFSVKNNTIPKSDKNYYIVPFDTVLDHMPRFADPKVGGKVFIIDKDDHYHMKDSSYENTRHKQPKSLMRYKKRKYTGVKWTTNAAGGWMKVYDTKRHEHNDFVTFFPNYPYKLPKMNKVLYMEKLVQHKTEKWERDNPKPMDMFTEDVEKWKQQRETAIERIRDFVISVYDKLVLTGRFKINKNGMATYQERKIAEIKDINGDGHHVNTMPSTSKLLKKAQKITDDTKAIHKNLVATNLRDHKKQKGRIILPQAA